MKHDFNITLLLLAMFFVTQIIGLVVIDAYSSQRTINVVENGKVVERTINNTIPYGMEPPSGIEPQVSVVSIVIAIIIATFLFFILTRLKASFLIKAWFFFVVLMTSSISINALFWLMNPSWDRVLTMDLGYPLTIVSILALAIAFILTFYKIVRRNFIVHNFTELLIYPGLAAIFVPILNVTWIIVLLLLISVYDMYAVWKSKHMVKLAKYQIQNLKIFTGFFVPYLTNESLATLRKIKKIKDIKLNEVKEKTKDIKVSLAILGGGDIAFPLIFAGVILRAFSFLEAVIVAFAATLSLLFLFIIAKKEKFYPAMPFITAGCLIGYMIILLMTKI